VLRDDEIYREHVRSRGRARATLRGETAEVEAGAEHGEGVSHGLFGGGHEHGHSSVKNKLHVPAVSPKLTQLH
jgi:hypothetical protein